MKHLTQLVMVLAVALAPALAPATPAAAQDPDSTGSVVGLVYDSTTSVPLAGASVAVVGTSGIIETNDNGEFLLEELPPGEHTVSFFHPRLSTLGVAGNSQRVTVSVGTVTEAYLTVPSRKTILAAWCTLEPGSGETGIGGVVTDELTGVPLPGAHVKVSGGSSPELQRLNPLGQALLAADTTENSGEYRICNLEADGPLSVHVTFANAAATLAVNPSGPQIMDIKIPISEPVTITGLVADYASLTPIPGASVRLLGTGMQVFADSLGRFGFSGVPPGKQVVVTEHLGYATRTDSLTVFSREALGLEIVLTTEAIALEPLVVTGRRRPTDILSSPGIRFYGLVEAQVDSIASRTVDLAGLMRAAQIPGLLITESLMPDNFGRPVMGVCVELLRGGGQANVCDMVEVRLNGATMPNPEFFLREMNPMDVKRIQFLTPFDAIMIYGQRGSNGVLLIDTK